MASNSRKLTIKDIWGVSRGNMSMEWVLDNVCLIFLEVIMFIEVSRMMPLFENMLQTSRISKLENFACIFQ